MKIKEATTFYEELIKYPLNIIGDMSYEEYIDWLHLGTKEDVEDFIEKLKQVNAPKEYIEVSQIEIKRLIK
jgi:hypothetical protein